MKDLAEIRATLCGVLKVVFVHGAMLVAFAPPAVAGDTVAGAASDTQAVPMTKLLKRVHEAFPGRILTVDLEEGDETEQGAATYEVKVLTTDGNVLKLFYDAQTLRLDKILGRYRSGHEPDSAKDGGGGGASGAGDAGSDDDDSHDGGDDSSGSDGESDGGSTDD